MIFRRQCRRPIADPARRFTTTRSEPIGSTSIGSRDQRPRADAGDHLIRRSKFTLAEQHYVGIRGSKSSADASVDLC
jgi:hypothetical protein